MVLYIVMALLPIGLAFFYKDIDVDKIQKRNYLIFVGLVLFVFLGARSSLVGSKDTLNYCNMMRKAIGSGSWSQFYDEDGVETGFQFFTFCLSRIFRGSQFIVFASAAIYVVSVCYFIYHNSDDAPLSLMMYITLGMMTFEMQGMRQSIAMSICLFAYEFAKRKKFMNFLLLVLLAMQFHQTAVVFIIIYFLINLKYTVPNLVLIFMCSFSAVFFADKIIGVANDVFDMEYNNTVDSGGLIATIIYVIIIVTAFWFNKRIKYNENATKLLYVAILGGVCYILRYFGALASERISFYFVFSQLALLPSTLKNLEIEEADLVKTLVVFLSILLFVYRLYDSDFIPYRIY